MKYRKVMGIVVLALSAGMPLAGFGEDESERSQAATDAEAANNGAGPASNQVSPDRLGSAVIDEGASGDDTDPTSQGENSQDGSQPQEAQTGQAGQDGETYRSDEEAAQPIRPGQMEQSEH